MWRLLGVVFIGLGFWAASLVLPRSDEQHQLVSLIGIATLGDPLAYAAGGNASGANELSPAAATVTAPSQAIAGSPLQPAASTPMGAALVQPASDAILDAAARESLVAKLQLELRRVGCYSGRTDGRWGSASRRAAKRFADRIKASVPTDEPDYAVLMLVEKFDNRACGEPCDIGSAPNRVGRCVKTEGTLTAEETQVNTVPVPVPAAKPARQAAVLGQIAEAEIAPPVPATRPSAAASDASAFEVAALTADQSQAPAAVAGAFSAEVETQSVFLGDDAFMPATVPRNGKAADNDSPAPDVGTGSNLPASAGTGWEATASPEIVVPAIDPSSQPAVTIATTAPSKNAKSAKPAGTVTVIAVLTNNQPVVVTSAKPKAQAVAAKRSKRSLSAGAYYGLGVSGASKIKIVSAGKKRRVTYTAALRTAYRSSSGAGSLH